MKSYRIIKTSSSDYYFGGRGSVLGKHSVDSMHTLDFILPTQTVRFSSVENIQVTGKCRVTDRIVSFRRAWSLESPPRPQHFVYVEAISVSESTGHTTWRPCPQQVWSQLSGQTGRRATDSNPHVPQIPPGEQMLGAGGARAWARASKGLHPVSVCIVDARGPGRAPGMRLIT